MDLACGIFCLGFRRDGMCCVCRTEQKLIFGLYRRDGFGIATRMFVIFFFFFFLVLFFYCYFLFFLFFFFFFFCFLRVEIDGITTLLCIEMHDMDVEPGFHETGTSIVTNCITKWLSLLDNVSPLF